MRFFVAPLVALSLVVSGAASDPGQPSPRPVVLLVHGRGVYGLDSAELRREWTRELNAGLGTAGLPPLDDADVRLAWYADVLDPASDAKCVTPPDTTDIDLGGVARGFLAGLGTAMEREGALEGRGLLGDLLFMVDSATRCGARRRVEGVIRSIGREGRPLIVVAYSLGSVVTYDLMPALDSASAARLRLITIGSPLGVPELRELLEGQGMPGLAMPPGIASWVNIYDPDDIFAASLGIQGSSIEDRAISNTDGADPHQIEHYLRDRQTGAAVGRALCASAPSLFQAGCTKL